MAYMEISVRLPSSGKPLSRQDMERVTNDMRKYAQNVVMLNNKQHFDALEKDQELQSSWHRHEGQSNCRGCRNKADDGVE